MENGKKHEEDENQASTEQYKKQENEGEQGNQYSEDQGEDENGPKPSADEQE